MYVLNKFNSAGFHFANMILFELRQKILGNPYKTNVEM